MRRVYGEDIIPALPREPPRRDEERKRLSRRTSRIENPSALEEVACPCSDRQFGKRRNKCFERAVGSSELALERLRPGQLCDRLSVQISPGIPPQLLNKSSESNLRSFRIAEIPKRVQARSGEASPCRCQRKDLRRWSILESD